MKQHPLAVGIEQRVHHRQREKHGQQHGNSLPARPAAEQQIINRRADRPRDQVRRVLDQHAETNGSHKKQEIHRRVAVGKSVRSHSIPQKEKVPKWGLHKNLRQASPRAFREKTSGHRVPALDAICRKSSQDVPNDFPRLNCPSTAAWYRWDCPIPMCDPTLCFYSMQHILS